MNENLSYRIKNEEGEYIYFTLKDVHVVGHLDKNAEMYIAHENRIYLLKNYYIMKGSDVRDKFGTRVYSGDNVRYRMGNEWIYTKIIYIGDAFVGLNGVLLGDMDNVEVVIQKDKDRTRAREFKYDYE